MWSRRRFLESVSAVPLAGGLTAAGAVPAVAASARKGNRDFFAELGVRPFINAAGTYTAMTASLMPPEVMEAINYPAVVKALKDGEPSIGIRSEKESLVLGVWMMRPAEDKIVARRLRQVLEKKG